MKQSTKLVGYFKGNNEDYEERDSKVESRKRPEDNKCGRPEWQGKCMSSVKRARKSEVKKESDDYYARVIMEVGGSVIHGATTGVS